MNITKDTVDRIIIATAVEHQARLISVDGDSQIIRGWVGLAWLLV